MNEPEPLSSGVTANMPTPPDLWPDWYDDGSYEGFRHYRSPFADDPDRLSVRSPDYNNYQDWLRHRELYEESGSPDRLAVMMKFVTATNPPLADNPFTTISYTEDTMTIEHREPDTGLRQWTPQDIAGVVLAILCSITVAGVFGGFKAAAGVLVVLFVIFAISWIVHD